MTSKCFVVQLRNEISAYFFSSKIHTFPKCNKNINYLFFSQHIFCYQFFLTNIFLLFLFYFFRLWWTNYVFVPKKNCSTKIKTQIWITRHVGVLLKSNRNTAWFRCCMEQLGMCFQRTRRNLAGYSSFRKSCYIGSKLFGCLH